MDEGKNTCEAKRQRLNADEDDKCFCTGLEDRNIIRLNSEQLKCSGIGESGRCSYECKPGYDEQPKHDLECVQSDGRLNWNVDEDIRCELEACPDDGIFEMRTPHPTAPNEKLTAMVVKFDTTRKIPFWSAAMFQTDGFGADFTHLPAKIYPGRSADFYKHPCPSLKNLQADRNSYPNTGWDRGHLTPAQAVRWSEKASRIVNLYINVAPQERIANQGMWKFIEASTYCIAEKTHSLVVTGTCTGIIDVWEDGVGIPPCFWKMIRYQDENFEHHVVGFIADNNKLPDAEGEDFKKRLRQTLTPRTQDEVLSYSGISSSPFEEGAVQRIPLPTPDGADVKRLDPRKCAGAKQLPSEIFDQWNNAMDPDGKDYKMNE